MFNLIEQVFIEILSFSSSSACDGAKCLSLIDEPCMTWPTIIYLNPVKLIHLSLV